MDISILRRRRAFGLKLPVNIAPSLRLTLFFSIAASLLLSTWSACVQTIPNPDAMFYLRAAELFAVGEWKEALSIYPWPLYSVLIALAQTITSTSALVSAQIVNSLLDCVTVVIFILLVRLLAPAQHQRIVFWAAALILLHPRLTGLRPVVIRDHGFYAFLLLALYFVVKGQLKPSLAFQSTAIFAILIAALFRFEGLFLLLLVPAYYLYARAISVGAKASTILAVLLVSALLIPAYVAWVSGTIPRILAGEVWLPKFLAWFQGLTDHIVKTTNELKRILPQSRNAGGVAYAGIISAFTLDAALRALTFPIAILAILSFSPRRLMPAETSRMILWFASWQLPLLLVFAAFSLFIDWRYAMAFAIIMTIPAVFTLDEAARHWFSGTKGKLLFLFAALMLIIPWIISLPRNPQLDHLREAGLWIGENLAENTRILTNDGRIAYFSGRPYSKIIVRPGPLHSDIQNSDYAAVEIIGDDTSKYVPPENQHLIRKIEGRHGKSVSIYKLH
jgi:hypothetical protein